MKQKIVLLSLSLFISLSLSANWQRPVTNYTSSDYRTGAQNKMLAQDENGWIYAVNSQGLLEFDGVNWALYPVRNAKMKAVKKGADGRIYVGGISQFGYFEPNHLGGLTYTSLVDTLALHINIGVVRNILTDRDRVYFQSDRYLYYWDGRQVKYIDYAGEMHCTAIVSDRLYVTSAKGIQMLNGERFVDLPGMERLKDCRVIDLLPYRDELLIVTRNDGFFIYNGTSLQQYTGSADDFIRKNRLSCAAIRHSLLVLGSTQDGLCLLNLDTGETEFISTYNGLQNESVLSLMFDAEDNLWIGLYDGIDYVCMDSSTSFLYSNRSVIGPGYASSIYRDNFYLGTNHGVYRTLPPGTLNGRQPMDFVEGADGQVWSFCVYDDKLFCALDNGIFVLDGNHMQRLEGVDKVRRIVPLNGRRDAMIAGTYGVNRGLYLLLKRGGHWSVASKIEGCDLSCKNLLAEAETDALWVTTKGRGVYRLLLSDDLSRVKSIKEYSRVHFPANYETCLAYVDHAVTIASHYGLWRYNHITDSLIAYSGLEQSLDGKTAYTYITQDSLRNIWYAAGGHLKLLRYDAALNSYVRSSGTFLGGQLIDDFESVYSLGAQVVVGTEGGFALLKPHDAHPVKAPSTLQIRRVYLTGQNDSLVYGRSYRYEPVPVVIPYTHNSLRIEYSVNDYSLSHPAVYSWRLSNGGDAGYWSDYSEFPRKEFTGLHEGKYVFHVRVQAREGEAPVETQFAFEVLPPWYRTWWSYLCYALLALLFLFYVFHRIAVARRRLLMKQELELLRQKQAFKKESEQKDRTIDTLKEEKLQAELQYKSDELIRTTSNIVRKNEMLLEIKKEVESIAHGIRRDNHATTRRKMVCLMGQIDINISHDDDLQAFQSAFDSVHHDFLKQLSEQFPELTYRERILCAYVRMNLMSKEIAPLMNISQRGVEISRFRLRKKLNLEDRESLAEFLQRFA